MIGFSANATIQRAAASSTTITGSDAITVIRYGNVNVTTVITSSGGINVTRIGRGPDNTSHPVYIFALIQNVTTGANVTVIGGGPILGGLCYLQPTGYTRCHVSGVVLGGGPAMNTYKVTLFVTKSFLPCSLSPGNETCASQLLAPPLTATVST
jgi:hypothetical protein